MSIGDRVRIDFPGHPWHALHARICESAGDDIYIVTPTAHGYAGRYAFDAANLALLCNGTIPGHNRTYRFPCVRDAHHDGPCNRIFPSGAPCRQCGCDRHAGQPCASTHCGNAPCRAGLSWEDWYAAREAERTLNKPS